jgi:tetratricopeptide (TPR) repeat protein/O-antigen ligase
LWLLAVVLVPLAFLGRNYGEWSSVIGSFELPKIVFLRTLVGLMAALWLVEWALQGRPLFPTSFKAFKEISPWPYLAACIRVVKLWLHDGPVRWVRLAVLLYLGSVVLSTVLSASFDVSMWGDVPGQDSHGAYTVVSYLILFGVVAAHLSTPAQLWRLLGAIVLVGILVAGYAVLQQYGLDFLDLMEPPNGARSSSTLANPIFTGAVLLITTTISLTAAAITLRAPSWTVGNWWKMGLWVLVLTVQLLGLIFTFSRGPWLGTILSLAVVLGAMGVFVGWRRCARASLVLALAAGLTALIVLLSDRITADTGADTGGGTASAAVERITTLSSPLGPQVGGAGIAGRLEIWKGSWRLTTLHPWFPFDSLDLSSLRPLIGYGPDLFRTTYLLESPPRYAFLPSEPDHAHNFFLHQGVELGFLGLMTSAGVLVSLLAVGGVLLFRGRRGYSDSHKLVLIGLMAAMFGRLAEQMVGVARVSDLVLSWVLLAAFVALPVVMPAPRSTPEVGRGSDQGGQIPHPYRSPRPRGFRRRWQTTWKLGAVVVLAVGIGVLTWTKSINYFRAALVADRGAEQFRLGDALGAASSLNRAISLAPDVSTYYYLRATVLRDLQEDTGGPGAAGHSPEPDQVPAPVVQAEENFRRNVKWVEQRPYYFRARLALADSAWNLGLLTRNDELANEAIRRYRETAEMVPNSARLWRRLAEVYMQIGQPEGALEPLENWLAITGNSPDSAAPFELRAKAHMALGRPYDAIADFDRAISLDPGRATAYNDRGAIYYQLGRHREAISDFDQAITIYPEYAQAYYGRGTVYYELGRSRRAIGDLDQAIRFDPRNALAFNNRGLAHVKLGQLALAIQDFASAINLDPQFALAYNNRGYIYRDLGQLKEATEDLDRAIQLDPQLAMAYYNRALVYSLLGMDRAAEQDAERAVDLGFDSAQIAQAMAELK